MPKTHEILNGKTKGHRTDTREKRSAHACRFGDLSFYRLESRVFLAYFI